ncbi:MAG: anthranilate phosphoribosyltransferase [Chloroflexi bacterium]|nr:anthranilate phosphoribosyltransferase [Chloroflexota bacterium]
MGKLLEALHKVHRKEHLSEQESAEVMNEILRGEATPVSIGALLVALGMKGETAEEIAGFARAMREHAAPIPTRTPASELVDTCGTGGDGSRTFNISTASAIVVAGAGVRVAKHGNRAMTSACGSADVLEALGAKIDLPPEGVAACIEQAGFGFMFAQAFHPAMKFAAGPRREIGVRTVFNILGPLTNPADAELRLLGVADAAMAEKMAQVLARLGTKHALVVHGEDGLDEVSVSANTLLYEVKDGRVTSSTLQPEDVGLPVHLRDAGRGGSPEENAKALRGVLAGEVGPLRDFTLINSAAALVAADLASDFREGLSLATEAIDSGAAREKLEAFVRISNEV